MDYSRPDRADRLAAEYVLGTLSPAARRRFQSLLPAHPTLRDAVDRWHQHLQPLHRAVTPLAPQPGTWRQLEQKLFAPTRSPAPRWWQRLGLWQSMAGLAFAGVVGLSVVLNSTPPAQPPVVVVLAANPQAQAAGAVSASFVASLSADGRALVLKPVNAPALTPAQALELWAVPAQGAPRSLGLVSARQGATVLREGLLNNTHALAVSLEPAGGSPTGAPTGPILSLGQLDI